MVDEGDTDIRDTDDLHVVSVEMDGHSRFTFSGFFFVVVVLVVVLFFLFFAFIWVFFHEHSRFTGQQGMGEAISLSPLYLFTCFTDT